MQNHRTSAARISGTPSRPPGIVWFTGILVGYVAYLVLFLQQPSAFGFPVEEPIQITRMTDLMVMPALLSDVFSNAGEPLQMLDRVPIFCGVLVWLAVCFSLGSPIVRCSLGGLGRTQHAMLSILAGAALLSTLTLFVGLAGALHNRWPLLSVVLLACVMAAASSWRMSRSAIASATTETKTAANKHSSQVDETQPEITNIGELWMSRLLPIMVCVIAAFYFLASCVPAWEFDVIEYHLQAPKEFWQAGNIGFSEHNIYANMPLAAEMHSLIAMVLIGGPQAWWWGGLVGKAIIGTFSLISALLLGSFVSQTSNRLMGWAAAGLLLSSPGNSHVASAGLIDMVLASYLLAMLVVATILLRSASVKTAADNSTAPTNERGRVGVVFLLSLFAGGAAACKYTGLVFGVMPAIAICLVHFQRLYRCPQAGCATSASRSLGLDVACFTLGLCLTCVPWLAKNWAQSGNPVYPLASEIFGGRGLTPELVARWKQAHAPPDSESEPAYSFTAATKSSWNLLLGSNFLNPSLVFLAAIGLVTTVKSRRTRTWPVLWALLMLWILAVWWLATHRIDRFWLPALPMASLIAVGGAQWIARRASYSLAIGILLFGVIFGALQTVSGVGPSDNRIFAAIHTIEQESLIETPMGLVNPTTAWINRSLSPQDKVLSIGEVKAYLYRVPLIYSTCFNQSPAETWLANKTPAEQHRILSEQGVTHVMIDWFEIERYRSPGNYGFSDWPQQTDFDAMVTNGVLRPVQNPFSPEDVEIFEVVDRE